MDSTDLTVRILQEIRDEVKGTNQRLDSMEARFEVRFQAIDSRFEVMDTRFVAIETTLRDLAEQMVMLARGVKVAIEGRNQNDSRIEDLERRVVALETKAS
ncbi:MAG: hypothetical protein HYV07_20165 [Deltaproteobacteria bacterium]|nr:hypothetical protein [Deltaproteobacteria bacterium]